MQRRTVIVFVHYFWLLMAVLLVGCNTPSAQNRGEVKSLAKSKDAKDGNRANVEIAVKTFVDSWEVPGHIPREGLDVLASVTIGKDGRVLSSHIVKRSGNAKLDDSVLAVLDKVHQVLPSGMNLREELTVSIHFRAESDLKSLDWPPKTNAQRNEPRQD